MDFVRIGDKTISINMIQSSIAEILELRTSGLSQQETGERLRIERTFISRLEKLGEVRKGKSIAAVGFPIANKLEVERTLKSFGVDFQLLMSEKERNDFVNKRTGPELMNEIMTLINKFRDFDTVIVMASDYRNRIIRNMLSNQVIEIDIGKSPLINDKNVDINQLTKILKTLRE